jgi:hemerythrin-like domain-containing protein
MAISSNRRLLLTGGAAALAGSLALPLARAAEQEKETPAAEDLMREHGVLRRALLAYTEAASRLRAGKTDVPADVLKRTAELFRSFGEDYHERMLEEKYLFPTVTRLKDPAARLPAVLKAQHDRGRAINEYVIAVTRGGAIASGNALPLADTLDAFVLMYEHHAAIEDTIVFPAWKNALPDQQYSELSERFEELEKKMFGKDGFEDALKKMAAIEQSLGIADLARFTAPQPPKPVS